MVNINYRDSRPIYEQIKDGFRKMIVSGALKADEKLPSVRDLSAQMSINPNTIQRAYRELEAEGYIYSVAGKGSFALGNREVDMKRKTELETKLTELINELYLMGVDKEEIVNCIVSIYGLGDNSAEK